VEKRSTVVQLSSTSLNLEKKEDRSNTLRKQKNHYPLLKTVGSDR